MDDIIFYFLIAPGSFLISLQILWMLWDDHIKWKHRAEKAKEINKFIDDPGEHISKYDLWWYK